MAKKPDLKAKEKRQKIIAAVGGVILLGVLGFQLPRTLKLMQGGSTGASSTPTTVAQSGGTSLAPPSLGGSVSAGVTTRSSGAVSDPNAKAVPSSGQLVRFGAPRFTGHDPFVQQVNQGQGTGSGSGTGAGSGTSGSGTSTSGSVLPSPPASGSGTTSGSSNAHLTVATISVDGVAEKVRRRSTFPKADPVFQLVSLSATSARIAIAGGSYSTGQQTVTLVKGTQLTLMNTANGRQYVLRLLAAE